MFFNFRQRYQVVKDLSKVTKMHLWMIQKAKKKFLAIFLSLVCWIDLILHIVIVLNVFQHSATLPGHERSFKDHKNTFWMIQRAKKEVFGHFLKFGLLDRLDIAYCDCTKCLQTFGNITRSWRIIQKAQYGIFEWSEEPKKRFLVIFWSLVCWIDLILHIMIVQNVSQHLGVVTSHAYVINYA